MNPRPPGYEPGELPDCSTPRRWYFTDCRVRRLGGPRAGNGTRTRDPDLGKVVLYQLSYSRNSGVQTYRALHTGATYQRVEARGIEPLTS